MPSSPKTTKQATVAKKVAPPKEEPKKEEPKKVETQKPWRIKSSIFCRLKGSSR